MKNGTVTLTIDGTCIRASEKDTILTAAQANGIQIPHLCFLKGINEISSCKVCVVEVEGQENLVASCTTTVREGMKVFTSSPKARYARRMNTQLLLSKHDSNCNICLRSGTCQLEKIVKEQSINSQLYQNTSSKEAWNDDFPLIRDSSKCIRCMRCVHICDKIQGCGIWKLEHRGSEVFIGLEREKSIEETDCTLCGQCITHCPTGALRERDDIEKAYLALADPECITVAQIAPAVRSAWAEMVGDREGTLSEGQMVAVLKRLGFDYVLDTVFTADLTIMEEGNELLALLEKKDPEDTMPLFTSCCPGWVSYLTKKHPELLPKLSTAKSPQQMFGALIKTCFAQKIGADPKKICSVSIMPCTAKKREALQPGMDASGQRDVDIVLTSRELLRMVKASNIVPQALPSLPFDDPMGSGTGAGVIFGVTGGVMEAALRTAYAVMTGKEAPDDAFRIVRDERSGRDEALRIGSRREAEFDLSGRILKTCTVSGLKYAQEMIDDLLSGRASYDFVEVMACPGGCVGGGGQPVAEGEELAPGRGEVLYRLDQKRTKRRSHENAQVLQLYEEYLENPLSEKAERLLHCEHLPYLINDPDRFTSGFSEM
ncbi:MAG: [FeFe] hydrogenase, group A [Lachnospiraceae bacterium]|nr:[FeFe] hydrogenase, group A [Lachnospiraceae bacterium]